MSITYRKKFSSWCKMKVEWMPDNPCDGCAYKVVDDYGLFCDLACGNNAGHSNQLIGQRKLLEYLINSARTNPLILHGWVECQAVGHEQLESMLKYLEWKNG